MNCSFENIFNTLTKKAVNHETQKKYFPALPSSTVNKQINYKKIAALKNLEYLYLMSLSLVMA